MNNLKKYRLDAGLTQAELAEKLDISPSSVGMYERGNRTPGLKNMHKISKLFNATIEDIFLPKNDTKRV